MTKADDTTKNSTFAPDIHTMQLTRIKLSNRKHCAEKKNVHNKSKLKKLQQINKQLPGQQMFQLKSTKSWPNVEK